MVDLSKWVEWVKLAPRYLLAIALVTGVVLFGPSSFTVALGLAALPLPVRIAFGIGFLGSTCLLVVNWLADMTALGQKEWRRRRELKVLRGRLHNLTPDEKVILRRYIAGKTRTQELRPEDGVVGGLTLEPSSIRRRNAGARSMPGRTTSSRGLGRISLSIPNGWQAPDAGAKGLAHGEARWRHHDEAAGPGRAHREYW